MNKAVVVIPVYKIDITELEKISLVQCCKVLGVHPICLVCPSDLDLCIYKKIFDEYKVNYEIETFSSSFFTGVDKYNELLLKRDFYERFSRYEFMLIYQLDAYVFSDELAYWCGQGFDYIGAPWFDDYDKSNYHSKMLVVAGNGGFSLRRISSIVNILNMKGEAKRIINDFIRNRRNEDGFFSQYAPQIDGNFKVAPPKIAMFFSFECLPDKLFKWTNHKLPFGCHAWEKYNFSFWRSIMKLEYLELKHENNDKKIIPSGIIDIPKKYLGNVCGEFRKCIRKICRAITFKK